MSNKLEKYSAFEAELIALEDECNFLPDVTTKEGYEKSKRIGIDGRKFEIKVDDFRKAGKKELAAEAESFHKAGQAACLRISAAFKPHQDAYKAVDDKKKQDKADADALVTVSIDVFRDAPMKAAGASSKSLTTLIEVLMSDRLEYGSRTIEAGKARESAVAALEQMKSTAILAEANAAQLASQKEEFESKQAEAAQAQAIIDQANQAQAYALAAERKIIDDKEAKAKAEEIERQRSIDLANQVEAAAAEAVEAEQARVESELIKAATDLAAREADKKHKGSIHRGIMAELMTTGMNEDIAKAAVKVLVKSAAITINY